MIIFSSPKPFRPDTEAVQKSAIRSWKRALPGAQIFLFGDREKMAEILGEEGVTFGGPMEPGPEGGELISPMFCQMARRYHSHPLLYLNSDIFLESGIQQAWQFLLDRPGPWLATSRRWCVPRFEGAALVPREWEAFWKRLDSGGHYGSACALDLFLMKNYPLESMPKFLIGHAGWDNWMIFHARMHDIPVIDLSREIRAIHCDHDYSYGTKNSRPDRRDGPLEEYNLQLLGGDGRRFHLGHATHELQAGRLIKKKGWASRQRNFELWRMRHPAQNWWVRIVKSAFRPLFRIWERHTTRQEDWHHHDLIT